MTLDHDEHNVTSTAPGERDDGVTSEVWASGGHRKPEVMAPGELDIWRGTPS